MAVVTFTMMVCESTLTHTLAPTLTLTLTLMLILCPVRGERQVRAYACAPKVCNAHALMKYVMRMHSRGSRGEERKRRRDGAMERRRDGGAERWRDREVQRCRGGAAAHGSREKRGKRRKPRGAANRSSPCLCSACVALSIACRLGRHRLFWQLHCTCCPTRLVASGRQLTSRVRASRKSEHKRASRSTRWLLVPMFCELETRERHVTSACVGLTRVPN
mmetsp:Transcript_58372/g.115882  ORF Transcript_58372/g.115882 Transcript_58372/m.115882 type:complete len:219 (+) Transcript_58372:196-852(+)